VSVVLSLEQGAVDFAPDSERAEILQNVSTILSTPKYSVPLNRLFGIDFSLLDQPMPRAMALITNEIVTAVATWEPRATVHTVEFGGEGMDGRLQVSVKVDIND
jgi:uncharacterized protein